MSDQRIYYVPPRRAGALRDWSGKDAPDGASWLVDHAASMNFNAIWLSPFMTTTRVEKEHGGKKLTGSLYAIRDHFMVDPEFSTGGFSDHDTLTAAEKRRIAAMDKKHLSHFCMKAAEKGMRVYADMVFNHVAADHPLVLAETKEISAIVRKAGGAFDIVRAAGGEISGLSYQEGGVEKIYHFKFKRNADLKLHVGGTAEDPWSDVAEINFASPAALGFFVTGEGGEKGYFKKIIDWHLDCGFRGFRCDVAYKVPPEVWQEVISHARAQHPDVIFLAETLGADDASMKAMARAKIKDATGAERPAFDYGMEGFYWWDYKQDWLPRGEHMRVRAMSHFGGAASPDTHDTETTLAKAFSKAGMTRADSAKACLRDYAIAALSASAVFMQMGFEYGNENQNTVFRDSVSDEERKNFGKNADFDITAKIRAVNDLKEKLGSANCAVNFAEYGYFNDTGLIRIRCEFLDIDSGDKTAETVLFINKTPEKGSLKLADDVAEGLLKDGFEKTGATNIDDILIFTKSRHDPAKPSHKPGQIRFDF